MKHFTRFTALVAGLCMFALTAYSQTVYQHYTDGQVYVKIKNTYPIGKFTGRTVDKNNVPQLKGLIEKYGITKVMRPFYDERSVDLSQTYRVYFSNINKVDELMAELGRNTTVQYAEKVPLLKYFLTPNDLGTQSYSNGRWALFRINAQAAWDVTTGSTSTKIAIVDNAVQTNHTDLSANIWVNPNEVAGNGIDDDNNGYIDDINGWDAGDDDNNPNPPNTAFDHGTHCAGIASGTTANNTGIASIGYRCKIIAVKATANAAGENSVSNGYDGVFYAYKANADVISMSWGGQGSSQTEQTMFNTIYNAGIVLIAAAGNDNTQTIFYPAGYNNVISVASTGNNGSNDQKSSFSNYGTWIDISAPGESILSTVPTNQYANLSGTSMACPLVAGLAGLIVSINPNLTPAQIENCLESTADNIDASNSSYIGRLGAGRINALNAVNCAAATVTPFDAQIINIGNLGSSQCGVTTFTPQVTLKNGGTQTLTSVAITWRVDNGTPTVFNWTGSLASQAQVVVNMPQITVTSGAHTYTATAANTVNASQTDGNTNNNTQTVSFVAFGSTGLAIPFTENFESANFGTNGWTLSNPDNSVTWDIFTTAGQNAGTNSARMNFYNYQTTGQRDGLISPPLNLSNLSAANLTFEYGYIRYNDGQAATATDSLIVYVSTDCGATWPNKVFLGGENGTGSFATAASSGNEFTPAASADWCFGAAPGVTVCPSINMAAYLGQPDVRIKFEGYNSYGNNLYIDDINLTGTVIVNQPPDAQFTTSATTICAGQTITFTNTSTNNPTSLLWTFPGGSPATSTSTAPVTVTFATAGTYNVKLRATNTGGVDSLIIPVTVVALPTLTSTPTTSTTICAGSSTTLTAGGATTYTWSPATGLSATTGATVTANPTSTQTYTITGTTSGCSSTRTVTVNVTALPNVQVTASSTICAGSSTTLTATGATSYAWSPSTGLSAATGATVTASPTSTQTYTVTGTANGCTKTAQTTVTVNPLPNVTAQTSNASVCSGALVTLTANGGTTYTWSGAGLNGTSGASVTANPTQTTTYTVTGTSNGCSKNATVTVTVSGTAPTVQASAVNQTICAGASTTLNANGATTYQWTGAGLQQSTGASVNVIPTQTTTYTVVGTTGSCFNTTTVTVTVNQIPSVQASTTNNTICTGATATLNATGATSYTWSGTNGFNGSGASVTDAPTQNTTYTVTGTSNGCSNTATVSINVGGTAPNVLAQAIKPTICAGESTEITASGAVNYSWSPSGSLSSATGATVTASPTQTTTYTVTGDDGNGCTNTFDVTINVNSQPQTPSITNIGGTLQSSPSTFYQWYKDGVLIQGATNQQYTPTGPGSYTVVVNDGGCNATSSPFIITGVAENAFNGQVSVYPNPANAEAFVDITLNTKATLSIRMFNSVGQVISQQNMGESLGGRYMLPVSNLADGIYFIEISAGTQYLVKKLVLTAE